MKAHALNLATTLTEENRDYVSAAHIYAEHLLDAPTAARLFCRGSRFADAVRLLALKGQQSLIPEIVDVGLADAMSSTTDFLADCKGQLLAQVPRIRELRMLRAADPLAFFGGDPSTGEFSGDIPDNISLAPTDVTTTAGRSMFTRYTGGTAISQRTSKTRRKEERKRASGKKGTVYEEEYLVNSVRRLIQRVNSIIDEVQLLMEALLRRGMRERAAAVEKAAQELLGMCTDSLEVFEAQNEPGKVEVNGEQAAVGEAEPAGIGGGIRPVNGDVAFWENIRLRDTQGSSVPIVREFNKLALIG